ncbi:MerR family transcriptional regulator [Labrys monachus]|uniref:DNA-binding transcriptional MerR regulator n=1 Tax=Labrys monachus TaxID=217067 RepID=A0ABU0FKF5_9HYPH|nr:MerR family transcriptional regulator [Labrys monachus]MDQ0395092.1 DNA-binding transcriptional MerR regulator [Labrys monachus]
MEKAPDAFRTISEVADDLDLPQHVLRFWETRFIQIKPLKRGGGRRYYRPDDIDLLKGIRYYLYGEGYTIKGVQRILKERGNRHVMEVGRAQNENYAPPVALIPRADEEERRRERAEWPEAEIDADLLTEDDDAAATPEDRIEPTFESVGAGPEDDILPSQHSLAFAAPVSEASVSPPPRPETRPGPPPASPLRDDRRRLQAVLLELGECKRILDAARG